MGFFNWVRSSVKSAVLAGFQDAHDELLQVEFAAVPSFPLRLGITAEEADVEERSEPRRRNRG